MNAPIIAIRPEPGLSQTIGGAREIGLEVAGHPLFEIAPLKWDIPEALDFDGLLIGSANAIRHGGPQLAILLDIPVFAVGSTTAAVAREAGFTVAMTGSGGLQELIRSLDHKQLKFLRLAGKDHVPLELPRSHIMVERCVYHSRAVSASSALHSEMARGGIVMLHSALAAEHFSRECSRLGIDQSTIRIAALGPRIADAAGAGWADIQTADEPSDAALLALVRDMCQ